MARNTGILASLAPYVAFMDADDLWEETKLACQVALMEARPESPLCYTDFSRGAEPGSRASALARYRPRRPGQAIADLLRENFICTSTVLLRRSALARSGLFDPDLRGPEDIDLWLRLADVGEFAFVDAVLAFKRDHTANLSSTPAMALEQSKLVRSLLRRWKADPGLRPLLLSRLREATMALAYAERLNGHYREARSAYARAAMLGGSPIRSLAMAGLLTLPRPILQLVPRISPARPAEARRIPAP